MTFTYLLTDLSAVTASCSTELLPQEKAIEMSMQSTASEIGFINFDAD
jgi:hypothetical protein